MPEVLGSAEASHFPDIFRGDIIVYATGWAGQVARLGKVIHAWRILAAKCEGKRTLGRPGRTCENNIKMYFRVVEIDMLADSI